MHGLALSWLSFLHFTDFYVILFGLYSAVDMSVWSITSYILITITYELLVAVTSVELLCNWLQIVNIYKLWSNFSWFFVAFDSLNEKSMQ